MLSINGVVNCAIETLQWQSEQMCLGKFIRIVSLRI
jgi:hypothetical protein